MEQFRLSLLNLLLNKNIKYLLNMRKTSRINHF